MKQIQKRIYQLHISLLDVKPIIWRRIRVPDHISFKKLHEIIQIAMGWENYHLYEFRFGPLRFGIPDGEFLKPDQQTVFDAARKKLVSMKFLPDDFMTYTYDFGDNWVHLIRVEAILAADGSLPAIDCLDGERACPPEDVGGSHSYQEFRDRICNPLSLKKRQELLDWYSGIVDLSTFNPNTFDLARVQQKLRSKYE